MNQPNFASGTVWTGDLHVARDQHLWRISCLHDEQ